MLRIGYDAKRLFNNYTGLGNYSRTLIRNLATYYPENAYFLYSPKVVENSETDFFLDHKSVKAFIPGLLNKTLWRSAGIKMDLKNHKINIFHGLSHEIPVGLRKTGIKSVVTIHDLLFKRYPHHYKAVDRNIYDFKFKHACKNADKVIAISEATKQDIIDFYGIEPERIEVIYQSCHKRFSIHHTPVELKAIQLKYNLPEDYLLHVGSVVERKNLLGIVKAMKLLPKNLMLPLVVIGTGKAYKQKILEYISENKLEKQIIFIKPSFVDMPAIYQKAAIFLYPSFGEGFGIPVLEALRSLTPVITSNVSCLPEAAGLHSALINPSRPAEIAYSIQQILTNTEMREDMISIGLEYSRNFDDEKLSSQMMELYLSL